MKAALRPQIDWGRKVNEVEVDKMACACKQHKAAESDKSEQAVDRYVSFAGIDCEGNAQKLMDHLLALTEQPGVGNAFWDKFRQQYVDYLAGKGLKHDPLYLLHANVFYIRDLFEEQGDEQGLQALDELEELCF
ncbi:N(2)-fixation sustaining protein CowN [Corallincola luteus]|nr:N(2)-fixation sustaining protein CowN [Corallincola luteus]